MGGIKLHRYKCNVEAEQPSLFVVPEDISDFKVRSIDAPKIEVANSNKKVPDVPEERIEKKYWWE